jgi:hypothetical protein
MLKTKSHIVGIGQLGISSDLVKPTPTKCKILCIGALAFTSRRIIGNREAGIVSLPLEYSQRSLGRETP